MIQDFKKLSFLAQSGLYLYLFIKKKEKQNLEGLVKKLRYVKEKHESLLYRTHIKAVLKNFTHNSDEIKVFKVKYTKWKENLSKDLVEILAKESEDDMEEIFKNIKDELNKKIVFNILVIEGLMTNNKNLKAFVDKLRKNFPTVDESNIK